MFRLNKILRAGALILVLAGSLQLMQATGSRASGSDAAELDQLFDALQSARNELETTDIQAGIWAIWLKAPDDNAQDLLKQGMEAMRASDLATALDYFDQLIKRAPDYAEGWNKRATVHFMIQAYEQSLADIDEVLKREPRHFGALFGRGLVLLHQEKFNAAIDAFREALVVTPGSDSTKATIDMLMNRLGQERL